MAKAKAAKTLRTKRSRKQTGGANPVKDWTSKEHVYCFGDLEGSFPFFNLDATFPKGTGENHLFTADYKEIKINLADYDALTFSGDLVDHGAYDVRWLSAFTGIAEQPNVICTIGNRDLNKIRYIDEYYIEKNVDGAKSLPWIGVSTSTTLEDLCIDIANRWTGGYNFKYTLSEEKSKQKIDTRFGRRFKHWHHNDGRNINDYFVASPVERVMHLYWNTCGIFEIGSYDKTGDLKPIYSNYQFGKYKDDKGADKGDLKIFRYEELKGMFNMKDEAKHSITFKAILICVTNMIMGVEWSGKNLPTNTTLLNEFTKLNGLYIKYLQRANLCAKFSYNGNNAIVSHSLTPAILSHKLGYQKTDSDSLSDVTELLKNIDKEKNEFLAQHNEIWNGTTETDEYKETFAKYIELSALTDVQDQFYGKTPNKEGKQVTDLSKPRFTGGPDNSPVVHGGVGDWYASKPDGTTFANMYDGVSYIIYGHTPAGLWPSVIKNAADIYEICLDISVVGDNKSPYMAYLVNGAYAFLEFKKDVVEPHIRGRITTGGKNFTTNGSAINTPEPLVYYDIPLNDYTNVKKNNYTFTGTLNNQTTTVKITYDRGTNNLTFTYPNASAAAAVGGRRPKSATKKQNLSKSTLSKMSADELRSVAQRMGFKVTKSQLIDFITAPFRATRKSCTKS